MILLSEREIEVWANGKDVVLKNDENWIELRPWQVGEAAVRLLDEAESIKSGTWRRMEWTLRTCVVEDATISGETIDTGRPHKVTFDFAVSMTMTQPNEPPDLTMEQFTYGALQPKTCPPLHRIYVAAAQVPRIVTAMLEALHRVAAPSVYVCTVKALRDELEERKADGRAKFEIGLNAVRRIADILRARRKRQHEEDPPPPAAPLPWKSTRHRRRPAKQAAGSARRKP
jgi:hypothetical protein